MVQQENNEAYDVLCAWCGATIGAGPVANSHGICPGCRNELMGLPNLTPDELDALPYGVIGLDATGVVRMYNSVEALRAGRSRTDVEGKSFFTEVAPCAKDTEFLDRFLDLVENRRQGPLTFRFTFVFPGMETRVRIVLNRLLVDDMSPVAVWVCISAERRPAG